MNLNDHIISASASLLEALDALNRLSGGAMTLFAVDCQGRLTGTVTDGDIRRALLAGCRLDDKVEAAMHRRFKSVTGECPDVAALRDFRNKGIRLVPLLNADGTIRSIVDLSERRTVLPLSAILMAGGKGERLRPLTLSKPKPLLEIDGRAIIDYNIEALAACGITDITVTTRYLAEQIHAHFARPVAGVDVKCVEETRPLGTIGSATLADIPAEGNTLVMNSDLLTTISFEDMYIHHMSSKSDITIAAIPYQVSVPFAILTSEAGDPTRVTAIEEKPSYSFFANAGIYIFPNDMLRSLPLDRPPDAPDLIRNAIAEGRRVTYFPINGTWLDVGTPADFHQAEQLMRHHRNFSAR